MFEGEVHSVAFYQGRFEYLRACHLEVYFESDETSAVGNENIEVQSTGIRHSSTVPTIDAEGGDVVDEWEVGVLVSDRSGGKGTVE